MRPVSPRRLHRPGSLHFSFVKITSPQGSAGLISASFVDAESRRSSHLKMDSEGTLLGRRPRDQDSSGQLGNVVLRGQSD